MLIFVTHDQALMWSRFERLALVIGAVFLVMVMDYLTSGTVGFISLAAGFVGQLFTLKCWMDIILRQQPFLNCWAFKE